MAKLRIAATGGAIVVGILALAASGLFAIGGAGMFGSPFQGTDRENLLLLLTLLLGPVAILPCALLDLARPGWGGLLLGILALADVAAIVAFNQRMWGFAIHDAALGSLVLAAPAFLIGSLLFFTAPSRSRASLWIWLAAASIAVLVAGWFSWQVGRDGLSSLYALLTSGTL